MVASLTIKLPKSLKKQVQELVEALGYQSTSEYVRVAIREKVEEDLIKKRIEDEESITLEEAKELIGNNANQNQAISP